MREWIKEIGYLIWYSIKDIFVACIQSLSELKKPRMWLTLSIAVIALAFYTQKYYLIKWFLPLAIIMYLVRNKQEGGYKYEMRKRAILSGNEKVILAEYGRYTKQCAYSHKEPIPYDYWKKEEVKKYQ